MSMPQSFSLGVGIVLRFFINTVFAQNDKLAGALSGIWDGIVAYAAWRTDRLLEPAILMEIIVGVCFDALFHKTPTRLLSLALGGALGVVVSDTAGLHALWDDLGTNVQKKLRTLDIKDDLDSPDVLSEFSEDVTVIYEERIESPRNRRMSTAEWIAAQRKARASKSTSRRASTSMNISTELDKSLLLSGFDTRTQVTTQTQSSRGRRDRELLATMTPLPPPSGVASSIDIEIDVHSPSSISRVSSPTIKSEKEEVRVTDEVDDKPTKASSAPKSIASASDRTIRRESTRVEPQTIYIQAGLSSPMLSTANRAVPPEGHKTQNAPSVRSGHSVGKSTSRPGPSEGHKSRTAPSAHSDTGDLYPQTPRSKHTTTDRSSFIPFIPPRPADTREPTIISAHGSHAASVSHRSPEVVSVHNASRAAPDVSSFLPFSFGNDNDLHARMLRSRASTRRTTRTAEPSVGRTQDHQSTAKSDSPMNPTRSPSYGHLFAENTIRSQSSSRRHSENPVSPSPEIIIDDSGETTRIYIPPPAETGINVRIVPRVEEKQHDLLGDSLQSDDPRSQSITGSALQSHDMRFPTQSLSSFPELETVPPPVEELEHGVDETSRSRASHAEMSSDPQPPSSFKLETAWRDSVPPESGSSVYGGRVAESDDPLPVYVNENLGGPSMLRVSRSRSNSASSRRSASRNPSSVTSRHTYRGPNSLDLNVRDVSSAFSERPEAATPAPAEWLDSSRAHSRTRRLSDAGTSRGRPLSIPRSRSHRQSSTRAASSVADESTASRRSRTDLFSRAQRLLQEAGDADARCEVLREEQRVAEKGGQTALAYTLGCELEEAEGLARRLHKKAERALKVVVHTARKTGTNEDRIDVQHLNAVKAVQAVKAAMNALQQRGGSKLTVFVGQISTGSSFLLKNYIVEKMTKKYDVRTDETDANVIYVYCSSNS